ncbi:ead/Ea22-like family protein, partial [Escherichia coli]|uniref:ead/Ea22-like family protein n=2 Tax=Escherichia coli TaxID=562 RepID=UPI0035A8E656
MHDDWGFDADLFHELVTPSIVLELLDERERNQQYIKRRDQENEDIALTVGKLRVELETAKSKLNELNRPGFPGECFICELRLPDHRFRWKHNKLFLLLPEEY